MHVRFARFSLIGLLYYWFTLIKGIKEAGD